MGIPKWMVPFATNLAKSEMAGPGQMESAQCAGVVPQVTRPRRYVVNSRKKSSRLFLTTMQQSQKQTRRVKLFTHTLKQVHGELILKYKRCLNKENQSKSLCKSTRI
jgi:hypothetical protein